MLTKNNHFRCDYCGRFIKNEDFANETAFMEEKLEWDYGSESVDEYTDAWHVACREKELEKSR